MTTWRQGVALGGALVMMMASACTSAEDGAVPLSEARSEIETLVPALQDAVTPDAETRWEGPANEAFADDADGLCRWRPGEWSTSLALPENDPGWDERRDRVNAVLEDHGLETVGDPGYTGGSAYGFETEGPFGSALRIDSWKGTTTIALHSVPVDAADECTDGGS